jgi:hypothetical protein
VRTRFPMKVLLPALALAAAVAITTAAGADQGAKEQRLKANRDTPAVMKDIKDGKAKKIKAEKRTYGVWDGCKFHYLKTDATAWQFEDGSVANVSENPEPLPPKEKDCGSRNPTSAELAEKEARVGALNAKPLAPGEPPPSPLPADRFKG